jgi:glycine cleavage system aminomethyltransferase T
MDPAGESYLRQEVQGLCIGFYEQPCKPWAVDGTPWNFGHELLPDNLDKVEDSIAFAFNRFPVLEHAGIKSVIYGPFTFAPDGNPLVGPVPRVRKVIFGSIDCMIQRVSYTGDLEFEIYCTSINQTRLFMILSDAGKPHGIAPFGIRAMMSLLLDRHFGSWLSEFSPDYTAAETGIDRFVDFHKTTDFIGRHAANAERDTPPDRVLATFEVDADDADVVAYEPVFIVGAVQGFCTSGGYSHHLGKSIAMALIPRAHAVHGVQAKIEIIGQLRAANMVTTSGFDPDMQKMWS